MLRPIKFIVASNLTGLGPMIPMCFKFVRFRLFEFTLRLLVTSNLVDLGQLISMCFKFFRFRPFEFVLLCFKFVRFKAIDLNLLVLGFNLAVFNFFCLVFIKYVACLILID